jgi:uncharacterized protein YuzB (UPF0349 family)
MRTISSISAAFLCVAVSVLMLAGCASRPEIRLDKDPNIDLGSYQTFAFFDPVATDKSRYTTLVSGRLKQATRDELERRNYVYSETNPDLRINFYLNVVDRQDVRVTPASVGPFAFRTWASEIDTVNYRQGTLSVDVVDSKQNLLVWQGIAEGRLSRKALENPGPVIEQTVSEVFTGFPLNRHGGGLASLSLASLN